MSPATGQADPVLQLQGFAKNELRLSELKDLPRLSVTIDDHGTPATFEGVSMTAVLERLGVPLGDKLRGGGLATVIVFQGSDGYRAVFALAEFDPGFSSKTILLADRRDGKALSEKEGPLRIAVTDEKRGARMVWGLASISMKKVE